MKRKIIELGNNCMVISLPIKWIRKNHLHKGDEINLSEELQSLRIQPPDKKGKRKEIPLIIHDLHPKEVKAFIVNAYRAGYDKIDVTYEGNKETLTHVVNNYLLGFELFRKEKHKYRIESVAEPQFKSAHTIIRKMLFILDDIIDQLGNDEVLSEFTRIQHYDNFLKRSIAKGILKQGNDPMYWHLLSNIAQIAKEGHYLSQHLPIPYTFTKQEKKLLQTIKTMLKNFSKAFGKNDVKPLLLLYTLEQEALTKIAVPLLKKEDSIVPHYLTNIIRLTYSASSALMGIIQHTKMLKHHIEV